MKETKFEYDKQGRLWKTFVTEDCVGILSPVGIWTRQTTCTENAYDDQGRISMVKEYVVANPKD